MSRLLGTMLVLLGLAMAGIVASGLASRPAAAAERTPQEVADQAAELARRAADLLMQTLRSAVESFPYETPRVTEEGDIIIRRKPVEEAPPAPGQREDLLRT